MFIGHSTVCWYMYAWNRDRATGFSFSFSESSQGVATVLALLGSSSLGSSSWTLCLRWAPPLPALSPRPEEMPEGQQMRIEKECVKLCTDSMRSFPSLSQQERFPLSVLSSSDALSQDGFPYTYLLVSFEFYIPWAFRLWPILWF